jgi:hypothetical protein
MINEFRRFVRGIERGVWLTILGVVIAIFVCIAISSQPVVITPEQLQPTLNAAATQQNIPYASLSSGLTSTPVEAMLTQMGPTLALEGLSEVHQYAASASADSARTNLDWGAVQAAGPPNTINCGDARTAWATLSPNGQGVLTLLFPQLVVPTHIYIHQSFNPGFVQHVNVRDLYGKQHTVYTTTPSAIGACPDTLIVDIPNADFAGNTVIVYLDQTTSAAGWDEIDAVELVGTRYN